MAKQGLSRSKETNQGRDLPANISMRLEVSPCGACAVRELAVCGALAPDELQALTAIVHEVPYVPHQTVFHECDEADGFFIITSGVATVSKFLADGRRQLTGFLYPSDFFGLAVDGFYANSVTAVTGVTLCRFVRGQYEALLDRFPKLEMRLLGQASNELALAQEQMLLLGQKTATEKLASILLTTSERLRRNGQGDNPLWLPMTREDIGDYLGMTTETTSRVFTHLEQIGAIKRLREARIEFLDRQKLHDIADGG